MDITIVEGDIVEQDVDAVVNAANSGLMGGGGVDGAILRAGGPAQLRGPPRRSSTASARCRPARRRGPRPATMPARWVIHVVGPVHSRTEDRTRAARVVLPQRAAVADELGARSIAFPAVSAGIYGWPIDDAADVAVRTVASTPTAVADVRFVLFSDDVARAVPAGATPPSSHVMPPPGARSSSPTSAPCCAATGSTTSTRCTRRSRRAATTCGRSCRGPTRLGPTRRRSSPRPSTQWDARHRLRLPDRRRRRRRRARRLRPPRRLGPGALEIGYWLRAGGHRPGHRDRRGARRSPTPRSPLAGVDRVEIHCDEANIRSAAVPRRLGYRLDRIETDTISAPGDLGRSMIWVTRRPASTPRVTPRELDAVYPRRGRRPRAGDVLPRPGQRAAGDRGHLLDGPRSGARRHPLPPVPDARPTRCTTCSTCRGRWPTRTPSPASTTVAARR